MAAGDTLRSWEAIEARSPAANAATLDERNIFLVLDFDATTDETAYFGGVMPRHYSGGAVVVTLVWAPTSATSGTARWEAAFERHDDGVFDLDVDSFAATQSAGGTAPGTSAGRVRYTSITFSAAQIDGLVAGESFRLLVRRDADGTTGTDDMAGDAELVRVEMREA